MKLGTEDKKKTAIAAALLIVAVFFLVRAFSGGEDSSAPATKPIAAAPGPMPTGVQSGNQRKTVRPLLAQTLDPTLRFDLLKSSEDVTYKGSGRDIFRSQPEPPPIPKPLPPDKQPNYVPPPPPPPPIDLKFYGFASRKDGYKRIFLSKGEDIFIAKEGDIVDRRYKIVHIGQSSVDVEDVLTNNRQTLPLQAG
ncbi:MAG: hypothetical protein ACLPND_19745 [Candidatus Korobacteraceae bacterium]|jgi:hypothetical protein